MADRNKKQAELTSNLITQAEAAQLRNVSRAAIRDLIRRGRLSSVSFGGREMVYRDEVLSFEQGKPGPVPFNEVTEFFNEHPDMGPAFRDFAIQYRSLAEVWLYCMDAHAMLWMLYKKKYRNADKLREFICLVYESGKQNMQNWQIELWKRDFERYTTFDRKQLQKDVEAGKITEGEAKFRDFIATWGKARYVIEVATKQAGLDAIFDISQQEIENAIKGKASPKDKPNLDQVRQESYRHLANHLRYALGNPFTPGHYEDFHHGRSNF